MDEIAFTLFGRPVAWYGILITCGMILAVLYALHICKFEGISSDDIIDFAFVVIVCGVLGARLYYVIFKWDSYVVTDAQNFLMNIWETLKNVVAVWEGGLAIYGGIIAGILTALVYARKRKLKFIKLLDILAPCVWIGQVIGRWGNFINMEAYGGETTLPWRMGLLYSYLDNGVWDVEKYVHPTFLYESLWNLTALVLVLIFYKKKKFDGQICSIYFMWYGFGRMLIEGLRTDSLMLGNLRISQGVGFVSLILGIVLTIVFVKKHQSSKAAEDTDYTPVYADLNKDTPDQTEKSTEE
ncbi:MAG: prolipoprotein diacylglyceryl transferase [Clostridia bacterium]|nr:prolipoprotein diacylglyceryl transferase [Clostridia bacterium]